MLILLHDGYELLLLLLLHKTYFLVKGKGLRLIDIQKTHILFYYFCKNWTSQPTIDTSTENQTWYQGPTMEMANKILFWFSIPVPTSDALDLILGGDAFRRVWVGNIPQRETLTLNIWFKLLARNTYTLTNFHQFSYWWNIGNEISLFFKASIIYFSCSFRAKCLFTASPSLINSFCCNAIFVSFYLNSWKMATV